MGIYSLFSLLPPLLSIGFFHPSFPPGRALFFSRVTERSLLLSKTPRPDSTVL